MDDDGQWLVRPRGYKGQERYRAATAFNTPRKWAKWNFGSVQPGKYTIYATWDPAGGSMPQNTRVKFQYEWSTAYLGTPTDTTVDFSQYVTVGQSTVYQDRQSTGKEYDGVQWRPLGMIDISDESHNVVLFAIDVQNKSLIADAAMLLPQGTVWPDAPQPLACGASCIATTQTECQAKDGRLDDGYHWEFSSTTVSSSEGFFSRMARFFRVARFVGSLFNVGPAQPPAPILVQATPTGCCCKGAAAGGSSSASSAAAVCPCAPACQQGESCFVQPNGSSLCANPSALPPGATQEWTECLEGGVCGNGAVDAGENCDDGNRTSGDGCSVVCQSEVGVCGNGVREYGEACDDGNSEDSDSCTKDCTIPACIDSDATEEFPGGLANFAVPGTVQVTSATGIVTVQDECYTWEWLDEWGCRNGDGFRTIWKCPRGCANGRCK